jgi:hypothetical protein
VIQEPVTKFFVPDWGDKVDYGIGLSYRLGSLCSLKRRGRNSFFVKCKDKILQKSSGKRKGGEAGMCEEVMCQMRLIIGNTSS